jgi:Gpi18-like mannosyltransferase
MDNPAPQPTLDVISTPDRTSHQTIRQRMRWLDTTAGLAVMFIVAFLIRVAIAPHFGFFGDLHLFAKWSTELRTVGTHRFYANDPIADYLPALLYVFWIIGKLSAAPSYLLLKLPALLADLGVAWVAGTVAARIAPPRTREQMPIRAMVAAAVLFNPAVIALSAGWGQVDSVPVFFLLASFLLLFTGPQSLRRDLAAALLFSIAFITKPQVCLAFPVIAYALYLRYLKNRTRKEALDGALRIGFLVGVGVVLGLLSGLPFSLGPSGLLHAYQHAARVHTVTSANAFNLWGLLGLWRNDATPTLMPGGVMTVAGIHALNFGLLAFATAAIVVLWQLHRAVRHGLEQSRIMFAAAAVLSLLGYTVLTRMHERYMFVALASFAPLVFARSYRWVYGLLSALFLLNLWYPYAGYNLRAHAPALYFQPWFDWIYGGFDDTWQKKVLSFFVTSIALVVLARWVSWLKKLEPVSPDLHLQPTVV